MRKNYPGLKTQLRLGVRDVEIFIKQRKTDEPYKRVALEDIVDLKSLPEYDFSIKWVGRNERPPRGTVKYSQQRRPSRKNPHQLSRQSSEGSTARSQSRDRKRARLDRNREQVTETAEVVDFLTVRDKVTEVDMEEADFEGVEEYVDEDEKL